MSVDCQALAHTRRRRLRRTAAALVVLILLWLVTPYPRRWLRGQIDYARGSYAVRYYGYPLPWRRGEAGRLRERYGVRVKPEGCVVGLGDLSYAGGYDRAVEFRLNARFGRDIFAQCEGEAEAEWKARGGWGRQRPAAPGGGRGVSAGGEL